MIRKFQKVKEYLILINACQALYYGAWFHSMVGNFEKAQEYMDRAVNMNMADKKKEVISLIIN